MTAHYFASKTRKFVIISSSYLMRPQDRIGEFEVTGKLEARKIAKRFNARPWNF